MGKLRQTRLALCAVIAVFLAGVDGHPALTGERPPLGAKAKAGTCSRSTFRVVIDVGHTAEVPGAMSARGVPEYTFNLQLGEAIKQALASAGFSNTVLLITAKPPPFGLVERAVRANTMAADLFIAIHHDLVPDKLLQDWEYEGQPQHFNDSFPGYALFISNDNPQRGGSLLFGKFLGKELQAHGLQYTSHYTLPLMGHRRRELLDANSGVYRYDQLVVLRYTRMPSLLLEAGSIINREEELALASPERRALTSAAVAEAVEEFCVARSGAQAQRPAAPRTSAKASAH